jgi:hypothetical protein
MPKGRIYHERMAAGHPLRVTSRPNLRSARRGSGQALPIAAGPVIYSRTKRLRQEAGTLPNRSDGGHQYETLPAALAVGDWMTVEEAREALGKLKPSIQGDAYAVGFVLQTFDASVCTPVLTRMG